MRKSVIFVLFIFLISGCVQQKAGEATYIRTVPVEQPVVQSSVPVVKTAGPAEKITVTAVPSTIRCGDKATITVTVKDALGQMVVDHTKVVVSDTTNPPYRRGYFDQDQIFTLNGVAQTVYHAGRLPSYVQITGFVGSRFGITDMQVIC